MQLSWHPDRFSRPLGRPRAVPAICLLLALLGLPSMERAWGQASPPSNAQPPSQVTEPASPSSAKVDSQGLSRNTPDTLLVRPVSPEESAWHSLVPWGALLGAITTISLAIIQWRRKRGWLQIRAEDATPSFRSVLLNRLPRRRREGGPNGWVATDPVAIEDLYQSAKAGFMKWGLDEQTIQQRLEERLGSSRNVRSMQTIGMRSAGISFAIRVTNEAEQTRSFVSVSVRLANWAARLARSHALSIETAKVKIVRGGSLESDLPCDLTAHETVKVEVRLEVRAPVLPFEKDVARAAAYYPAWVRARRAVFDLVATPPEGPRLPVKITLESPIGRKTQRSTRKFSVLLPGPTIEVFMPETLFDQGELQQHQDRLIRLGLEALEKTTPH